MKFISPYKYNPELPQLNLSFEDLDFENSPVVKMGFKIYIALTRKQVKDRKEYHFTLGDIECYEVGQNREGTLPAIIYCHGGGFIFPLQPMMFVNSHYYAEQLDCRVFLPEYRIAPEYPFPTPFLDCYNTYRYVLKHSAELGVDPDRIVLLGDSAGGALAAAVCQKARDEDLKPPVCQMLLYPVTDNRQTSESNRIYPHATWSSMCNVHMWNMYLKDVPGESSKVDADTPFTELLQYAAPLQAKDFSNLPPCYMENCEIDTLHDEGVQYAEAMSEAGVNVLRYEVPGAGHGYDLNFDNSLVQRFLGQRVDYLKNYL